MSTTSLKGIALRKIVGSEIDQDTVALRYWLSQSAADRLAAVEQIRDEYHRWSRTHEPGLERTARLVAVE